MSIEQKFRTYLDTLNEAHVDRVVDSFIEN